MKHSNFFAKFFPRKSGYSQANVQYKTRPLDNAAQFSKETLNALSIPFSRFLEHLDEGKRTPAPPAKAPSGAPQVTLPADTFPPYDPIPQIKLPGIGESFENSPYIDGAECWAKEEMQSALDAIQGDNCEIEREEQSEKMLNIPVVKNMLLPKPTLVFVPKTVQRKNAAIAKDVQQRVRTEKALPLLPHEKSLPSIPSDVALPLRTVKQPKIPMIVELRSTLGRIRSMRADVGTEKGR